MKTKLTKNTVRSLCYNNDRLKPALEHLQYRPDHGDLVATNGHALIKYKVEVEPGDKPVLINPNTFKTKISDPKDQYNIQETECSEQYPDITTVERKYEKDEILEIGINLDLLKSLCNAATKDRDGNKMIRLKIPKDGMGMQAMQFEQAGNGDQINYSGLIMPVRLEDN
tara:strand:+ start:227 stop:733 length:507 start_codon:yes stop_codon:yes gene_type:complete